MKSAQTEHKAKILIVEDNEIDRTVVRVMLQKHFHVDCASDGHEALHMIGQRKYDIILMDIDLGDDELDGVMVMKQIRNQSVHDDTRIFAVTAYDEDREWFVSVGFDELYSKPVIKEEMLDAIQQDRRYELVPVQARKS
jgi:CheY-like chemotaxis protein